MTRNWKASKAMYGWYVLLLVVLMVMMTLASVCLMAAFATLLQVAFSG